MILLKTITVQIFIKKRKHSCSKRAGRFNKDIDEPNRKQRNVRMVAADNNQVVYSHYFLGVFFPSKSVVLNVAKFVETSSYLQTDCSVNLVWQNQVRPDRKRCNQRYNASQEAIEELASAHSYSQT